MGGGEEAAPISRATGDSERVDKLFANDIGHVRGASGAASSRRSFHGYFLCFCHWFQSPQWNGQCIRDILWAIIWSKTIPYAWNSLAKSHGCSSSRQFPARRCMVQCRRHSSAAWPRFRDRSGGWPAQNNVLPMTVIAAATAVLHCFVCWGLVFRSGLGNRGAALANAMSYWINAVALAVYVRVSPSCRRTWTGFSSEAFRGIFNFLKLSIPSALMLSLEIWSFEMVVLLSGLLPNPKLETSVLSISLNTAYMIYMIPLGISGAVSTRVSNELGARRSMAAILAGRVAMGMVATEGTMAAIIIIVGRRLWGYSYSTDETMVGYLAQILVLLAILHIFDGIQSILSGITRGCGRQKIGAFINLGAYYLVGIPTSIFLAFFLGIGGKGLWMGIMVAVFLQALFLGILILSTNWDSEVKKAADRVTSFMPENLLE
ncbi:protein DETOXIFICATION 16-like isoform X2 [Cucumis melo]|uniref:Protein DETOXIFICATION 16-like isoform X2 n=1 Tax=Cucumis melo TaxID=3656 RepID=A0ABM3KTZ0_CUCME|nr:protein DETOXIFICATION 16-like isoform X2 [Cucumis melo]